VEKAKGSGLHVKQTKNNLYCKNKVRTENIHFLYVCVKSMTTAEFQNG